MYVTTWMTAKTFFEVFKLKTNNYENSRIRQMAEDKQWCHRSWSEKIMELIIDIKLKPLFQMINNYFKLFDRLVII